MLRSVRIFDGLRLSSESEDGESWAEVAPRDASCRSLCDTRAVVWRSDQTPTRVPALQEPTGPTALCSHTEVFAAHAGAARFRTTQALHTSVSEPAGTATANQLLWWNVMKVNEIDIFSATMFRHLEKIPHACEATCARQIRRDLRKCNGKDRIDFDLAFLHSVPLAYGYSRTMPYAHATRDTAGTDSVAQILYEQHVTSLNAEAERAFYA
jgi:hypothetical protein